MSSGWTRELLLPPFTFWVLALAWLGSMFPWTTGPGPSNAEAAPSALAHFERLQNQMAGLLNRPSPIPPNHRIAPNQQPDSADNAPSAAGAPTSPNKFQLCAPDSVRVVAQSSASCWAWPKDIHAVDIVSRQPDVPPPRGSEASLVG